MNRYEFKVTLSGYGETPEEGWMDAVEGFSQDPGSPEDEGYKEVEHDIDY